MSKIVLQNRWYIIIGLIITGVQLLFDTLNVSNIDVDAKVLIGYDVTPIKISSEELHIGLIAQEVEKVAPQLVKTNEDTGLKTVNYTELIPALINAIKELNERIKMLEK